MLVSTGEITVICLVSLVKYILITDMDGVIFSWKGCRCMHVGGHEKQKSYKSEAFSGPTTEKATI